MELYFLFSFFLCDSAYTAPEKNGQEAVAGWAGGVAGAWGATPPASETGTQSLAAQLVDCPLQTCFWGYSCLDLPYPP